MSNSFAYFPLLRRLARPAALALFLLPITSALTLHAQHIKKAEVTLPAPAQAVIDRLSTLRELPDGQWKMHSGDIAHGEALHVDESCGQISSLRSKAPK